jgi:16S rRNA (uracil1498-N3)-methyltransferase
MDGAGLKTKVKRFLIDPETIGSGLVRLNASEARHALNVLRKEVGEDILLVDGDGREYTARIVDRGRLGLTAKIIEEHIMIHEPDLDFTMGLSLLKSDRMDMVIQKATELGITSLVPLETDRAVIRLEKNRAEKRLERWRSIARQAIKQCGRPRPVNVFPVSSLQQFLDDYRPTELKIMFHPFDNAATVATSWKGILESQPHARTVCVLIGPEGGFNREEASLIIESGFCQLSLGPRILRAETAALAAMAIIGFELGDLSKIP